MPSSSCARTRELLIGRNLYELLPGDIVRGALARLGYQSTVTAGITSLPQFLGLVSCEHYSFPCQILYSSNYQRGNLCTVHGPTPINLIEIEPYKWGVFLRAFRFSDEDAFHPDLAPCTSTLVNWWEESRYVRLHYLSIYNETHLALLLLRYSVQHIYVWVFLFSASSTMPHTSLDDSPRTPAGRFNLRLSHSEKRKTAKHTSGSGSRCEVSFQTLLVGPSGEGKWHWWGDTGSSEAALPGEGFVL